MRGLEWGRIYEAYRRNPYDPKQVSSEVHRLYADPYVKNRRGIFEYILGGSTDTKLLDIRVFDEAIKRSAYAKQKKKKPKQKESPTVPTVPSVTTPIKPKSGHFPTWMLTTSLPGAKEEQQTLLIARCSAKVINRAKGNR